VRLPRVGLLLLRPVALAVRRELLADQVDEAVRTVLLPDAEDVRRCRFPTPVAPAGQVARAALLGGYAK
jgi:hypothetical protein